MSGRRKDHRCRLVRSVTEDALQIRSDEPIVDEAIEGNRISDVVADDCAAVLRLEGVLVDPETIGTANLFVDESMRRIPGGDAGAPPDRQTVESQPIVDQGVFAHFDREGGHGPEAEPRRRDGVEIRRIGEELEHTRPWRRQPEFGVELPDLHCEDFRRTGT